VPDTIAAPPGWYYVRVADDPHLKRYPVAAWRVEAGRPAVPLLAKPGEAGLVPPSPEDVAALVGLCPPDREFESYFSSEDIQQATLRLVRFRHPREAAERDRATVREVDLPGVGPYPVRDARPPGQRADAGTADWIKRAWGGSPGQPRLGAGR
jgi:hypothetical protein